MRKIWSDTRMTSPWYCTRSWRSGASTSVTGTSSAQARDVGERERLAGGLEHQPRDVLAHVRHRLVVAGRRPRAAVQEGDGVRADRLSRRSQHVVGDDGRVKNVVAGDGGRAAVVDDRPAVDDQRETGRQPQADARASGARERNLLAAEHGARRVLARGHRIEAAHQPAARAVAAERAVAPGDPGVEVEVDHDRGAGRERRRERHLGERAPPDVGHVVHPEPRRRAVDARVRDLDAPGGKPGRV